MVLAKTFILLLCCYNPRPKLQSLRSNNKKSTAKHINEQTVAGVPLDDGVH